MLPTVKHFTQFCYCYRFAELIKLEVLFICHLCGSHIRV